jgi:hypothetical protein
MIGPEDEILPPPNLTGNAEVQAEVAHSAEAETTPPVVSEAASDMSERQSAEVLISPSQPGVIDAELRPTPEELQAAQDAADTAVISDSHSHTRRSFLVAAAGIGAVYGFYHWIDHGPEDLRQPVLLRRAFQRNAKLSRAILDERALAPTYPLHRAEVLRVNGVYGLKQELVPESWRLQLVGTRNPQDDPRFSHDVTAWEYRYETAKSREDQGHDTKVPPPGSDTAEKMPPREMVAQEKIRQNRTVRMPRGQEEAGTSRSTLAPGTSGLLLTLEDILKLPRHELVTQFKCIEGWSQIVHWAGVRLRDFLEAYPPALVDGKEPRFVYMETPNGDYYVGFDMNICRHPQSLLVTEMMGAPLTQYHGAPLRLHMPTKYGYKQIKRIGLISYTNDKPDDYWTKLGYDWYAGL